MTAKDETARHAVPHLTERQVADVGLALAPAINSSSLPVYISGLRTWLTIRGG